MKRDSAEMQVVTKLNRNKVFIFQPYKSQPATLAKRCYGEIHKYESHGNGDSDEPAGSVARPGAQGGVQPSQRENGKDRGNDLVKKLAKRAPETPKPALLLRCGGCACGRVHNNILTQNLGNIRNLPLGSLTAEGFRT